MQVTPTVREIDVRFKEYEFDVIRFADDYQNKVAGACRVIKAGDWISIANEGYSRVTVTSAEQAQNLIKALEQAIALGWVK